jgi:hypothetical protein
MNNGRGGLRQGRIGDKGEGGVKAENMSAGWSGGTKSKRLHTIAGLGGGEQNGWEGELGLAVPMQGSKTVAVRQEMEVGGVLGTVLVMMLMTMLVTVLVTLSVTVSVTVSVMVSATVSVTGSVTVLVGMSRAVVKVLGPAAAMLVPAVELGPSGVLELAGGRAGTRSGHFIGLAVNMDGAYAAGRCAWHSSSMVTALRR